MGLFGTLKVAGEGVTTSIREWAGTDYFVASAATVGGAVSAAYLGEFVPTSLKVSEKYYLPVKEFVKFVWSGILYYVGIRAKAPLAAVSASLGAMASIGIDLVQLIFKKTPEQAGAEAALAITGRWMAATREASEMEVGVGATQPGVTEVGVGATQPGVAEAEIY